MNRKIIQATMAGILLLGTVGLSQLAQAQCASGFCGALSTLIQRPALVESPIVSSRVIEQPVVVERAWEQPMVVERTCEQPIVVERTFEAPAVFHDACGSSLLNFGMPLNVLYYSS